MLYSVVFAAVYLMADGSEEMWFFHRRSSEVQDEVDRFEAIMGLHKDASRFQRIVRVECKEVS